MSCILYELSQNNLGIGPGEFGDEKELANYCQAFQRIYSDGYRQRYSVILDMLTDIDDISSENQDETPDEDEDCLELLSANLALLREYSRTHTKIYGEYTFYGIAKLSDHVDIEIHRYRDKQSMYHDLSETDDNVYALIDRTTDLERMLSESRGELQDAHRAAEKLQMQMVAILGIFAAIVMAFSGGMDLLSGAISVSGDSDIFRVAFVVLLCGIVLFNILAFLMYMILAIINAQNKSPRRPGIRISKRSIRISRWLDRFIGSRFIIAFNIILIIAMIVDVICMFLMI